MKSIPDLPRRLENCRGVLVDSSVLLDVSKCDPVWGPWSLSALTEIAEYANLLINPIVYAEVSIGYDSAAAVDEALPVTVFHRVALPFEAAFLAGKCFLRYRRRGGVRTAPLPDFYIGAHAAVEGWGLLTRDTARFQTYFPTVEIFAPAKNSHH